MKKVKGIKLKTSNVLFSKTVVRNIEENDKAIAKGLEEMKELIKKTSGFVDKAVFDI